MQTTNKISCAFVNCANACISFWSEADRLSFETDYGRHYEKARNPGHYWYLLTYEESRTLRRDKRVSGYGI